MGTRVIFDNYSNATSLTSELRYASSGEDLTVDDSTPIKDKKKFLSSRKTKDYLLGREGYHIVQNTCRHCYPQKFYDECHQQVLVHTKKLIP